MQAARRPVSARGDAGAEVGAGNRRERWTTAAPASERTQSPGGSGGTRDTEDFSRQVGLPSQLSPLNETTLGRGLSGFINRLVLLTDVSNFNSFRFQCMK